ncbi:kinesin family member 23 [Schistosoma bovis]|uniref:Kinesin family member 23 n=1 Tax=Schistosoma bovis TaxID=6184 RepID=A0A430Q4Q4_SCHBO|nr:kinesin family member 23 [Schistosoma bovis]
MEGSSKDPGILPRSLDVIFNSIGQFQTKKYVVKPDGFNGFIIQSEADALMDRHRSDFQQRSRLPKSDVKPASMVERTCESISVNIPWKSLFAVFVSLIEVYNNSIYDLLQDVSDLPGRNLTTRILREDSQRNVYVYGGVEVEVKSADEALDVLCAANINNSLMNLRKCIKALRDIQTYGSKSRGTTTTPVGHTRVVPYRDARLTYLFKNFFEGDGRVAMLVCIQQAPEEYEETMNIDDQATQIFADLDFLDREVTSCLNKMSNGDSFIGLNLDFDITDFNDSDIRAGLGLQDQNSDLSPYESEQDSAPEQDRLPRPFLDLKIIDTNPLRALINRRLERKKQAYDSLQTLFPSLQALFIELLNNEKNISPEVVTANQPKPGRNLVSTLSKQWESRLAQQQAEAKILSRPNNNNTKRIDDRVALTPGKLNERRAAPAFNPRHRRSRSVGGDNARWLEHQEANNTPLGTIFTPNLKHRKSVTRVELKDTLNADNYLLHHQEADSDGNVETSLFKGAIIPTAGGGSAVVFNDVEVLRQSSPGREQRKSSRPRGADAHLKQVISETSRRSGIKRRYSNSPTRRPSNESVSTHSSQSTMASDYCPMSPSIEKISTAYNDAKCYIGIDCNGGMGLRKYVF